MAGQWDQGVDYFVAKCIQKKPRAHLPVVTLGLVMTSGKGGADWLIR